MDTYILSQHVGHINFWLEVTYVSSVPNLQKLEHAYTQILGMYFDASLAQHQICIITTAL